MNIYIYRDTDQRQVWQRGCGNEGMTGWTGIARRRTRPPVPLPLYLLNIYLSLKNTNLLLRDSLLHRKSSYVIARMLTIT